MKMECFHKGKYCFLYAVDSVCTMTSGKAVLQQLWYNPTPESAAWLHVPIMGGSRQDGWNGGFPKAELQPNPRANFWFSPRQKPTHQFSLGRTGIQILLWPENCSGYPEGKGKVILQSHKKQEF